MNKINIAFVSDNNYFKHMCVAIESIVKNSLSDNLLNFFIFNVGINNENIKLIENRYRKYKNINLKFLDINEGTISNFKVKTHVSVAAFSKIYISELIDVDKLIYLDCDLIVNTDIVNLWNEFEENVILKAVWNPFYDYDNKYLGIDNKRKTFNSGVMLLRLDLMKKDNSSKKLNDFIIKFNKKTKLHDQAAFNAVFKDKWVELDNKWNVQVSMLTNKYKKLGIEKKQYFELYKDANIVHFTSNSKPWQFRNVSPYKKIYTKTYRLIFGKIIYDDNNIRGLLQRLREFVKYKYYYISNMM